MEKKFREIFVAPLLWWSPSGNDCCHVWGRTGGAQHARWPGETIFSSENCLAIALARSICDGGQKLSTALHHHPLPVAGGPLLEPRALELVKHVHPDPAAERAQRGQVDLRKQRPAQCCFPSDGLRSRHKRIMREVIRRRSEDDQ